MRIEKEKKMSILDFFRKKKAPEKKIPATLEEVPYPGCDANLSLKNNEVTRGMLDIFPKFLEIEGLGKIMRDHDYRNTSRDYVHSILGGFASSLDEEKFDEPVQKVLDITQGRPLFDKGDYFDRTGRQHSIFILENLMWLPPERRLPVLNRIKADLNKVEDNGRAELYMIQSRKLKGEIFGEELLDYWKKEGYTVEEALNYDPDKPVRHNVNGLMKQLGGVDGKLAVLPEKTQGKVFSNTSQAVRKSGLEI